jgi:hypothetical protein
MTDKERIEKLEAEVAALKKALIDAMCCISMYAEWEYADEKYTLDSIARRISNGYCI